MIRRVFRIAMVFILFLLATSASAASMLSEWGLSASSTAHVRGFDAAGRNAASLALDLGWQISLASVSADLGNNALSLARYNASSGADLNEEQKREILQEIPEEGWALGADLSAGVLGIRRGFLALGLSAEADVRGNLDRDFFDLVLMGNDVEEPFDFGDSGGEASLYASADLALGLPVYRGRRLQAALGVRARYLQGFYHLQILDTEGALLSGEEGLEGSAEASYRSARGGSGQALDLSLAIQWKSQWSIGATLENAIASIHWDQEVEEGFWEIEMERWRLGDDLEFAASDSIFAGEAYTSELPRDIRAGLAWQGKSLLLVLETEDRLGDSRGPVGMMGVEWQRIRGLRPRIGLGFGKGGEGISAGLGLRLGALTLDTFAGIQGAWSPSQTRGLKLGARFLLNL
ncbi:MAG: DUF5723 family protein [Candidatus Krumholzibacteria bacterium]|jgi:hypothetical protein|nr:DUF5723 family protein [Candidatus Krumholzibacteria bacterium]MDP7021410.1 DUF5723 family protein [Candidatus Krumholzibacteria bacterium]